MYNEPIGEILAEARNKLGKNIKEVEFETKIRAKFIGALERDDFDCLPGSVYARGFIKTYAVYLGLDPEPLIQQYKLLYEQQDNSDDMPSISPNLRVAKKKRSRWFKPAIALGVVAAVFVGLITWGAVISNVSKEPKILVQDINTRGTSDTTVASVTVTTKKDAVIKEGKSDVDSPASTTTTTKPAVKPVNDGKIAVTIKLTGINETGSWVLVEVDEEKAFVGLISNGESKLFKAYESIRVRAGNSPGLEVMLNGKKLPQLETVNGIADKTFKKGSSNGEG